MKVNLLVIGAGISGVSIAYNLAKKGMKGIHVIDKGYFTNGATGRCGAGVRMQWATTMNCLLAKQSIEFFEKAEEILDYKGNLEFKQEGYLMLATTQAEELQFDQNVALQHSLGIPSRRLTKAEAIEIVPHLNPDAFLSATFCQKDGHLNPFKMTEAYYLAAKKLGVTFSFYEEALRIEKDGQKITKVITNKQVYETHQVVNAAGAFAKEIGLMVGVEIPIYAENHEILATEPVERIQGPMVMSFSKNIYCQQVPHGAFLMGRSNPKAPHDHSVESSWEFLDQMAKTAVHIMPLLGKLRVIRQWGGSYDMSPDRQPILSGCDHVEGFYIVTGFSGHGFMLAPMTGILMSELILNEKPSMDMTPLHLNRFKDMTTFHVEKSVV